MGGVSQSRIRQEAEGVVFEGEVSLRNNGGFASLRGPVAWADGTSALELAVHGDSKRYRLLLRMDSAPGAASYQCDFEALGLQTHRFAAADFQATFRGRLVSAAPLAFARVVEFGILIADKQEGPFVLQLRHIRALGVKASRATCQCVPVGGQCAHNFRCCVEPQEDKLASFLQ
jgi:hypothetical protein